ncbi:hypothetical protein ACP70R_048395 [Stipagrostis hirtigluma subsp. patula]
MPLARVSDAIGWRVLLYCIYRPLLLLLDFATAFFFPTLLRSWSWKHATLLAPQSKRSVL